MRKKTDIFIVMLCFFCLLAEGLFAQPLMIDTSRGAAVHYGVASFYADKFNGRKTANGEIFSQKKLTAAHNTLPLGTLIVVTNLRNNESVTVKVNDRLHHRNKRIVDLSKAAARKIGMLKIGITRVKVVVLH
jgi:rare lipoprotein A